MIPLEKFHVTINPKHKKGLGPDNYIIIIYLS